MDPLPQILKSEYQHIIQTRAGYSKDCKIVLEPSLAKNWIVYSIQLGKNLILFENSNYSSVSNGLILSIPTYMHIGKVEKITTDWPPPPKKGNEHKILSIYNFALANYKDKLLILTGGNFRADK